MGGLPWEVLACRPSLDKLERQVGASSCHLGHCLLPPPEQACTLSSVPHLSWHKDTELGSDWRILGMVRLSVEQAEGE